MTDPVSQALVAFTARVCHEVNRAYCEALGDNSQVPWADAPKETRDSAVSGVAFALADSSAGPEAQHEQWMAAKLKAGWVFGDVKDPEAKTHPCLVPYGELPIEQRVKDSIFQAVVRAMSQPGHDRCS